MLKLDIFKSFNELQYWNIPDILLTLDVSKVIKFKEIKDLHPSNIYDISVTEDVLNEDIFSEVKEEQSLNIYDISFIFVLSKLSKFISFNPVL